MRFELTKSAYLLTKYSTKGLLESALSYEQRKGINYQKRNLPAVAYKRFCETCKQHNPSIISLSEPLNAGQHDTEIFPLKLRPLSKCLT
jgi:hypothetical protein